MCLCSVHVIVTLSSESASSDDRVRVTFVADGSELGSEEAVVGQVGQVSNMG